MKRNQKIPDKQSSLACCGEVPSHNEDACCKLDEEKKAEGLGGCGCSTATSATKTSDSPCC